MFRKTTVFHSAVMLLPIWCAAASARDESIAKAKVAMTDKSRTKPSMPMPSASSGGQ